MHNAIRTIVKKTRDAGKFIGCGSGADPDFARRMADRGVQWIHVGCDFEYMRLAPEAMFRDIREEG